MRETITRFLLIQPLNEHAMVLWGLGVVWLMMILNCLASIRQQPISLTARFLWLIVIVAVPIVGMAAYLIYCLAQGDYSFLKFLLGPPKKQQIKVQSQLRLPAKN